MDSNEKPIRPSKKTIAPTLGRTKSGERTLKKLEEIDFELMGYLLSCHLVIEHYMDEFLVAHCPDLDWDSARLTFEKRVALISNLKWQADPFPAIKHLNALRNRFSHRVNYALSSEDLMPIVNFLHNEHDGFRQVTSEPRRALHVFTLFCCDMFLYEIDRATGTRLGRARVTRNAL